VSDATSSQLPHPTGTLQSSAEELRAMFSALPDTIMVFSSEGICLSVAPTSTMNLIAPADISISRSITDLFPPADADNLKKAILQATNDGEPVEIEHTFLINGRPRFYSAKISPAADGTFVWVARDITERKFIEEMLLQRQQELMG
jgi:PAS domain S-box-containing protein